jgi:hypothetical protein
MIFISKKYIVKSNFDFPQIVFGHFLSVEYNMSLILAIVIIIIDSFSTVNTSLF